MIGVGGVPLQKGREPENMEKIPAKSPRAPKMAAEPDGSMNNLYHSWSRAGSSTELRVIPDACADLIWFDDCELIFVGVDSGPRLVTTTEGKSTVGIRLKPGSLTALLNIPANELLDQQIPAVEIWPGACGRLESGLASASIERQSQLLLEFAGDQYRTPDFLIAEAAGLLIRNHGKVAVVADLLGLSERQLRRRVLESVGYGPKMLARVARLNVLKTTPGRSLAELAHFAGYSSQAHMSDEVRWLTGLSAVRFLEDSDSALL